MISNINMSGPPSPLPGFEAIIGAVLIAKMVSIPLLMAHSWSKPGSWLRFVLNPYIDSPLLVIAGLVVWSYDGLGNALVPFMAAAVITTVSSWMRAHEEAPPSP